MWKVNLIVTRRLIYENDTNQAEIFQFLYHAILIRKRNKLLKGFVMWSPQVSSPNGKAQKISKMVIVGCVGLIFLTKFGCQGESQLVHIQSFPVYNCYYLFNLFSSIINYTLLFNFSYLPSTFIFYSSSPIYPFTFMYVKSLY